jgi:hypothetical protein
MSHETYITDNLDPKITKYNSMKAMNQDLLAFLEGLASDISYSDFNTAVTNANYTDNEFNVLTSDDDVSFYITAYINWCNQNLNYIQTDLDRLNAKKSELEALENETWTEDDAAWRSNPTWRSGD